MADSGKHRTGDAEIDRELDRMDAIGVTESDPALGVPPMSPRSQLIEARVREIIKIMTSGRWVTTLSPMVLAERWGSNEHDVGRWAGEAARRIRCEVQGHDEIVSRVMSTLETITALAMERKELRTAVEALRVLTGVSASKGSVMSQQPVVIRLVGPDGTEVEPFRHDKPPLLRPKADETADASGEHGGAEQDAGASVRARNG